MINKIKVKFDIDSMIVRDNIHLNFSPRIRGSRIRVADIVQD